MPTKLEIIETTLSYLRENDIDGAVRYLETIRDALLREKERKKERTKPVKVNEGGDDPCMKRVMEDPKYMEKIYRFIEEKMHQT